VAPASEQTPLFVLLLPLSVSHVTFFLPAAEKKSDGEEAPAEEEEEKEEAEEEEEEDEEEEEEEEEKEDEDTSEEVSGRNLHAASFWLIINTQKLIWCHLSAIKPL